MRNWKRFLLLLFVTFLFTLFPTNANAVSNTNDIQEENPVVTVIVNDFTPEETEKFFQSQLEDQLKKLGIYGNENYRYSFSTKDQMKPLNDISDYKHEWAEAKEASIEDFVDGQPYQGVRFPNTGYLFYSQSGGHTVSVSVRFPEPYGFISLSGNIGSSSAFGTAVPVYDTKNYYKLKARKFYSVRPCIIYKKQFNEQTWSEEWVEWGGFVLTNYLRFDAWAERVY